MWWVLPVVLGNSEVGMLGVINQTSDPAWVAYGNSIYPNFTTLDLDTFTWFFWDAPLAVTPVNVDVAECKGQLADGTAYVYAPHQREDTFNEAYNEYGFSVARSGTQSSSPYEVRHYDIKDEHNHDVDYTWFQLAVGTGHFIEADPWICRSYHTCRFPNGHMLSEYDTSLNGTVVPGQLNRKLPVPSLLFTEEDLGHQWLGHEGRMLLRQTLVVNGSVAPRYHGQACYNTPVVFCRPRAGTPRLDGPSCKRVKYCEPHAYFAAAAIFVVWAAHASFSVSAPTAHSLRDLATGFVIWWPANVIGDGMPLFVADGANAAIATLLLTLGNIAVLCPWPKSVNTLRTLAVTGCVAVALSFVNVPAAAFTAGFTGAAATSFVWGLVHNAKAVGIGMTLSAVLSSVAMLVFKSTAAYVAVTLVIAVAVACLKPNIKVLPAEDKETLIEAEEGAASPEPPQPFQWEDNAQFFAYYGLAYALPGVLPTLGFDMMQYKFAIAFGTAGDIFGRLFSGKSSIVHLPLSIIAFVAVIMAGDFASRVMLIVCFYALRGDAVTLIATNAAADTKIGVTGQIGALAGAFITAFATKAFPT